MKNDDWFNSIHEQEPSTVTCLGLAFENDEARRNHFIKELRKKLQEPEFRNLEGFPIGRDEDILNLSDPPYYTACPNPWITDFITEWEAQKSELPEGYQYHKEPYAGDVSEGKNDPIYKAHSYHTKVPHKAIMRYILHYTEPGDIIFDGFCGTGMTGVAARMCGDREQVMSLGYRVKPDGTILQKEVGVNGKESWRAFSKLGMRKAVLNDLSPIATFVSSNYLNMCFSEDLNGMIKKFVDNLEDKWGWLYQTKHSGPKIMGKINYIVWSDVFICPECVAEVVFYDVAFDREAGKIQDDFVCDSCGASLNKNIISRATEVHFDMLLEQTIKRNKQVPVLINYTVKKKRYEKKPDTEDIKKLADIERCVKDAGIQATPMMHLGGENWGAIWRSGYHYGITHVHHFYTYRNLLILHDAWQAAPNREIRWAISGILNYVNRRQSYTGGGGGMPGVLYIASLVQEKNFIEVLKRKLKSISKVVSQLARVQGYNICGTQSTSSLSNMADANSIDYIFIDPPFGSNIMYSEGSFLWESQLSVWTNQSAEAIESTFQGKAIDDYRQLMTLCFEELYRILKPGRWITVEFSNTKSAIWNSIQVALTDAGFIVANLSALDKKQGGFKSVTTPTAVKQDLVISAYKPSANFEKKFISDVRTEKAAWDFVRAHLKYLPVTRYQGTVLQFIPERDPRILFDQMVAYYVRNGYFVPVSSHEFQAGLMQRFIERDGMYFLQDQIAEYDRKKMISGDLEQMTIFVTDEASAIGWIRRLIKEKPQTFSDINQLFMQQLGGWSKNETQLDLRELLSQNFLCYEGEGLVPEQIHGYLSSNWKELRNLPKDDPALIDKARDRWYVPDPSKAGDLEQLREKALLKEFEEYKATNKKFNVFRLEAVRAGFRKSWHDRNYIDIVTVANKIPKSILEEDPKLLMWYDQAMTRMGDD